MSETDGFAALAEGLHEDSGAYTGYIPSNWMQGRTAYGGLTCGLAHAAALRFMPELPPLRSMQCGFIGPVGEAPIFTPSCVRQGKNVTVINVDVHADEKPVGRVLFFFGATRESQLRLSLTAPEAGAPETTEPFTPEPFKKLVPRFFSQFDTRLIAGGRPGTGHKEGYIRAWSRHTDEASRVGMGSFLTLGDVLPPAALPTFTKFGPMSSINWQVNIVAPDIDTREGWWHVETRLTAGQDGYSSQIMRFWNTDGVLFAEGTQSVAIFM